MTLSAIGPDGPISWAFNVVTADQGTGRASPDTGASSAVDAPGSGGGGGVVLSAVHKCSGRLVHTAAARARIRDLEQEGTCSKNDAVALAVRYIAA